MKKIKLGKNDVLCHICGEPIRHVFVEGQGGESFGTHYNGGVADYYYHLECYLDNKQRGGEK
jgi:hypothetical protein